MDSILKLTQSQSEHSHESDSYDFNRSQNSSDEENLSIDCSEESSINQPPINLACERTNTTNISPPTNILDRLIMTIDDHIRELKLKYEIQEELGEHFRLLQYYEIIIVCDDSGSMMTTVDGTNRTRWDELREIVNIVLQIGTIFDSSGVDIFFLNRPAIYNVTDPEVINEAFSNLPRGYTPLVPILQRIFELPVTRRGNDKKVLVFIATDGAPTDDKGNPTVNALKRIMTEVRNSETTYVMFLLCTDDLACIDYLNEWDETMDNVDVTDDFKTERDKIRSFHGANYPFSKGDYIVKALVGAIVTEIDHLNERS